MTPLKPPNATTPRRQRRRSALLALAFLSLAACGGTEVASMAPMTTTTTTTAKPTTTTTSTTPPTTKDPSIIDVEDGWYLTATPKGTVKGYDGPNGTPTQDVTNTYYNWPTQLPVIDQRPGWLHVRLAPKPNGSTIWIKRDDADIGKTPWKIVINLTSMHLQLFKEGQMTLDAPVGIGTDATPTATGEFFMTFKQPPANAGYGPWVMVTSGHSNVLQTFDGFPDGVLAIHGPIGSDGLIGDTGAKISNGCIRMHLADQLQLADVTPGSPIQIVEA